MDKLLKALEKESKDIRSADIVVGKKVHKVYYRIMSGDDHSRALELSKKTCLLYTSDAADE